MTRVALDRRAATLSNQDLWFEQTINKTVLRRPFKDHRGLIPLRVDSSYNQRQQVNWSVIVAGTNEEDLMRGRPAGSGDNASAPADTEAQIPTLTPEDLAAREALTKSLSAMGPSDSENVVELTDEVCARYAERRLSPLDILAASQDPEELRLIGHFLALEEKLVRALRSARASRSVRHARPLLKAAVALNRIFMGAAALIYTYRDSGHHVINVIYDDGPRIGQAAKIESLRRPPEGSPQLRLLECIEHVGEIFRALAAHFETNFAETLEYIGDDAYARMWNLKTLTLRDAELWAELQVRALAQVNAIEKFVLKSMRRGRQVTVIKGPKPARGVRAAQAAEAGRTEGDKSEIPAGPAVTRTSH